MTGPKRAGRLGRLDCRDCMLVGAQCAMDDALVDVQPGDKPSHAGHSYVLGSEPSQLFDEVLTLTYWISLKVKVISSRVAAWDIWSCS